MNSASIVLIGFNTLLLILIILVISKNKSQLKLLYNDLYNKYIKIKAGIIILGSCVIFWGLTLLFTLDLTKDVSSQYVITDHLKTDYIDTSTVRTEKVEITHTDDIMNKIVIPITVNIGGKRSKVLKQTEYVKASNQLTQFEKLGIDRELADEQKTTLEFNAIQNYPIINLVVGQKITFEELVEASEITIIDLIGVDKKVLKELYLNRMKSFIPVNYLLIMPSVFCSTVISYIVLHFNSRKTLLNILVFTATIIFLLLLKEKIIIEKLYLLNSVFGYIFVTSFLIIELIILLKANIINMQRKNSKIKNLL